MARQVSTWKYLITESNFPMEAFSNPLRRSLAHGRLSTHMYYLTNAIYVFLGCIGCIQRSGVREARGFNEKFHGGVLKVRSWTGEGTSNLNTPLTLRRVFVFHGRKLLKTTCWQLLIRISVLFPNGSGSTIYCWWSLWINTFA